MYDVNHGYMKIKYRDKDKLLFTNTSGLLYETKNLIFGWWGQRFLEE